MGEVKVLPGACVGANVKNAGAAENVVARLESLADLAREGKIRAIAYAFVDRQGVPFDGWVSAEDEPTGNDLIAGATYLQHRIVAQKLSDERTKPAPS